MSVINCHICDANPAEKQQFNGGGLAEGIVCPVCYQPTCRYHLGTVRWRWRKSGETDHALVCKSCLRSYEHRHWDKYNRDWIT